MGLRKIKISDSLTESLFQGFALMRAYENGIETAIKPEGDITSNNEFLLGLVNGTIINNRRIAEGVVASHEFQIPGENQLNFDDIVADMIVIIDPDGKFTTPGPHMFTWSATPADYGEAADTNFGTANGNTTVIVSENEDTWDTAEIQVNYVPRLSDNEAAGSFDVGNEAGLNTRTVSVYSGYADVHEPGDIISTMNYDSTATFVDGYAYALTSGKIGDDATNSRKVAKVLRAPSPDRPDVLLEILPAIHTDRT